MENKEIWRPISYAPAYSISSLGRVKRDGRILKFSSKRGYRWHILCVDGVRLTRKVHRMVCEAFNGHPPSPEHHAAHRDGNTNNNTPENLYWATAKENMADRERHGTTARGHRSGAALHPEKWIRGDKHWTRQHPEKVARGDNHPRRLRPEIVPRGEDANCAKLTAIEAWEIRSAPHYHGVGRDLAAQFGVSMGLITAIRKGRAWAHLTSPPER